MILLQYSKCIRKTFFLLLKVSSSTGSILAPTSPFLHSTQTAQQNILSLLADRTHDLWAKANSGQAAGIPIPPIPPVVPAPHPTVPPAPIFPFAALASANGATPTTPPLLPMSITPSWDR